MKSCDLPRFAQPHRAWSQDRPLSPPKPVPIPAQPRLEAPSQAPAGGPAARRLLRSGAGRLVCEVYANPLLSDPLRFPHPQIFQKPLMESELLTEKEGAMVFVNWKELIMCNIKLLK